MTEKKKLPFSEEEIKKFRHDALTSAVNAQAAEISRLKERIDSEDEVDTNLGKKIFDLAQFVGGLEERLDRLDILFPNKCLPPGQPPRSRFLAPKAPAPEPCASCADMGDECCLSETTCYPPKWVGHRSKDAAPAGEAWLPKDVLVVGHGWNERVTDPVKKLRDGDELIVYLHTDELQQKEAVRMIDRIEKAEKERDTLEAALKDAKEIIRELMKPCARNSHCIVAAMQKAEKLLSEAEKEASMT